MKRPDDALDRLFRGAARAHRAEADDSRSPGAEERPQLSPELEARILAQRPRPSASAALALDDSPALLLALFRRGAALAALIALVTVLICLRGDESQLPAADAWVLDSVSELSFLP
jgi:hypothetical protein